MHIRKEEHVMTEGLRVSGFYRLLQDAAGAHCGEIGLGSEVTGPRNLIWVVVRQQTELERWPRPGERFILQTWPGDTRHMFYPRFHLLTSPEGEVLGRSSALWTLVDRDSRKMISPAAYGLDIKGLSTGQEAPLPTAPARIPTPNRGSFTVSRDVLDSNGHMNNTRYYDVAEEIIGRTGDREALRGALTEYVSEALEGETISLAWGQEGGRYFILGTTEGEKNVFRMGLEYEEK